MLESVIECEKVVGVDLGALFSITGHMSVQTWMATRKQLSSETRDTPLAFVRWMHKTKELWVYGDKGSREHATNSLRELATEIDAVEVLDTLVRLDFYKFFKPTTKKENGGGATSSKTNRLTVKDKQSINDTIKKWLAGQPRVRQLYHYSMLGDGRVVLSGSKAQADAVLAAWSAEKKLLKRRIDSNASTAKPDCGVCIMTAEDPIISFALCNHVFCLECMKPAVTSLSRLPICCPAANCGSSLYMNDIVKITGDTYVDPMVEAAVFDYVAKHPEDCVVCPKPGCNQILSASSQVPGPNGGHFINCDACRKKYCLDCSSKAGSAMETHANMTCAEFQVMGSSVTARHVRYVQDHILNLSCPRCKAVFLDFSGCTCVECGNSSRHCYFCANCLEYSSSSSADCHEHVRYCSKNPAKGGYFVSERGLATIHGEMRALKLVAYFRSQIADKLAQRTVFKLLAKDLDDLHVQLPLKLQGSTETSVNPVLEQHARHIREKILNLCCPTCQLVFIDFDFNTCSALTCANVRCRRSFCACCLADCGEDAHPHVSKCSKNPNRPAFYVTEEDVTQIHLVHRQELVREYLINLAKDGNDVFARTVLEAVHGDLRALGIELHLP